MTCKTCKWVEEQLGNLIERLMRSRKNIAEPTPEELKAEAQQISDLRDELEGGQQPIPNGQR